MAEKTISLTLKIWRQNSGQESGRFESYSCPKVPVDASFLEMLDILNEDLTRDGKEPVSFDHDCREGICGTCGAMVNGIAHGPLKGTTLCQLHMRHFKDGDTVTIEPFRSSATPVVKDLVIDRSAMDRIIQAGGYVSVRTGSAQDANNLPVAKDASDEAFNAAACIGCSACVAACPNASASLFVGAKFQHLNLLPQGQVESDKRHHAMVHQMEKEGFGACSNAYQCEAACPKEISVDVISAMNRHANCLAK